MMATPPADEVPLYMGVEGHESVKPVDLGATLKLCPQSSWAAAMSLFRYFKSGYSQSGYFKLSTVDPKGLLYKVGVREGDVISSVNLANIECWPIGDLAERIKKTTVLLLGIRRYEGPFSLPTYHPAYHYAIVKLGIKDSRPILDSDCSRFADGRYYRDVIPYLSLEFKPYNTFRYMDTVKNVSIKAPGKGGLYLAITNGAPTFQEGKYEFKIYTYVPNSFPAPGYSPVVIVPKTDLSLALYSEDCSFQTKPFSESMFMKPNVPGCGYIFSFTRTANPNEIYIEPYQAYENRCGVLTMSDINQEKVPTMQPLGSPGTQKFELISSNFACVIFDNIDLGNPCT